MQKGKDFTISRNEGGGNLTAAREYNQAQREFVRSGQVDRKAREAEKDLKDEDIRRELERVETVGKRHAAKEGSEVKRRY